MQMFCSLKNRRQVVRIESLGTVLYTLDNKDMDSEALAVSLYT